jgi:hypothetical protein
MKRPRQFIPHTKPRQKPMTAAVPPAASGRVFDTWLQRASHLAQVALVVITGLTIYYTVIPLYGKALVDEQIARKEVELERVSNSLDKLYVNARHYAVVTIVQRLAFECTMGPPDMLMAPPGESFNDGDWKRQRLDLDRSACLSKTIDEMPETMAVLRPYDAAFFRSSVETLGVRLEKVRAVARSEFASAQAEAERHPDRYVDHGSFQMRMADQRRPKVSEQQYQTWLIEAATDRAREAAISKLTDASGEGIHKLRDIKWPDPPAKG